MRVTGLRRTLAVVAAAAALTVGAPTARADAAGRAEAGREFRRGEAAFKRGAYPEAADAFERAYAIAPHPDTLFNAAEAREKAGQYVRAARLYVRVLAERGASPKNLQDATRRVADLNARLARVVVVAPGAQATTIDGEAPTADETYADPGDHVVVVTFASGAVTRNINAGAGLRTRVVVEPETPAPIVAPPPPVMAADKPLGPAWFFAAAGVTAALGGATIASGVDANAARTAFDRAPTSGGLDAGQGKVTRTNVLVVSTVVAGVATAAIGVFAVRWKSVKAARAARVLRLEGSFE